MSSEVATINPQQLAPVSDAQAVIHMIERAARDPSIDLDKMERLLAWRERAEERVASQSFDRAMSDCQAVMKAVAPDSDNPQTKSSYASYAALDRALRPIYSKHGFVVSFNTGEAPELSVRVLCRVAHKEGCARDYHIDMPADGKGPKGNDVMTRTHATGSAITYGRRYLLLMIFNIAVGERDDDGNGAGAAQHSVPDYGERITKAQAAELRNLLEFHKVPEDRFLAWAKVSTVEDIPPAWLAQCKVGIKSYKGPPA